MPLLDLPESENGSSDGDRSSADNANVIEKNKRRSQTDAARTQRFKNLLRKQKSSILLDEAEKSDKWASEIQKNYFTTRFYSAIQFLRDESPFASSCGDNKKVALERARAVMSLLIQKVLALRRILTSSEGPRINHVLECVVLDDSSCHLRNQGDGTPSIYTVMNTVQTVHISYSDGKCTSFSVPTPFMCLQTQKTEDLHTAYTSNLLMSSCGVGQSVKNIEGSFQCQGFQVASDKSLEDMLAESDAWQCQVMIGDALPTNDAVFKLERKLVLKDMVESKRKRRVCFRMKCQLHQLRLVRKPAVLSVERFWTTVVRLGYLFEQYSFKRQFALALVQIPKVPDAVQRA